jgi:hypothetical protein
MSALEISNHHLLEIKCGGERNSQSTGGCKKFDTSHVPIGSIGSLSRVDESHGDVESRATPNFEAVKNSNEEFSLYFTVYASRNIRRPATRYR